MSGAAAAGAGPSENDDKVYIAHVLMVARTPHNGYCSDEGYYDTPSHQHKKWFSVAMSKNDVRRFLTHVEQMKLEEDHIQEVDEMSGMLEHFHVDGDCGGTSYVCDGCYYSLCRMVIRKVKVSAVTGMEEDSDPEVWKEKDLFPAEDFVDELPGLDAKYFPSFEVMLHFCEDLIESRLPVMLVEEAFTMVTAHRHITQLGEDDELKKTFEKLSEDAKAAYLKRVDDAMIARGGTDLPCPVLQVISPCAAVRLT